MNKISRGTSIIEVVIAAALISVAVISALSLSNHSQKQSTYARNLAQSSKYLTEAADWLRTERNELGWATIAAKVIEDNSVGESVYCLNNLPSSLETTDFTTLLPGTCGDDEFIPGTLFQRIIIIDEPIAGSNILKSTVIITWAEQVDRQATIELELNQW